MENPEQIKKNILKKALDSCFNEMVNYSRNTMGPGINKISEITSHLCISNYDTCLEINNLKDFDIDFVIYLGLKAQNPEFLKKYELENKNFLQIKIPDFLNNQKLPNLANFLEEVYLTLHNLVYDKKKILICCDRGVSLSGGVLLYYFLRRFYLTNSDNPSLENLEQFYSLEILKFLKEFRPCLDIHPGWLYQILVLEIMIKENYRKKS